MSEVVGPMSLSDGGPVFLGEDMMQSKTHSPDTARLVDEEVRRTLIEAETRCRELLVEYRKGLDLIARALLEHESIDGDEVYRLLNLSGANLQTPGITALTADDANASVAEDEEPAPADAPLPDADLETAE
jgi:cell division protease FtsH